MKALVVLNPNVSKRLIGRAVSQLPEVKKALEDGRVIIAGGTTNGFVAEEITGKSIEKAYYTAGIVSAGKVTTTDDSKRLKPISLVKGEESTLPWNDVLTDFVAGDIFIKGGNAVDLEGNVGVLSSDRRGGTIGLAYGPVIARGAQFICPVSLEKLIPDVLTASIELGQDTLDLVAGLPVGLIPVPNATVISEIEAFEVLYGISATHVASGGVNGSEGAVTIVLEGDEQQVKEAFQYIESIKDEAKIVLD
ncbi:hypothetical protein BHU72_01795 [Desulfuribacillus stibiiarsenatis]|uniref:Uncharacterized protein n=1 Tax=Desulfuribacillus stibiiarsenatis TaxID=1390249 RepID=A0A1E5LA78_9FIRM|nr:hypothetical protein [Desulfuribacillus stibiiarsenatis]OEH87012.1 hypothetical protein BHU72_01795 [Desulfuribacillus stibiiarsenatis]